jgi:hypothetical protein
MKKINLLTLFLLFVSVSIAQNLKPIAKSLHERKMQRVIFRQTNLFEVTSTEVMRTSQISSVVQDALILSFNQKTTQEIIFQKPENIHFTIPVQPGQELELELYRSKIFSADFSVVTATNNGEPVNYQNGIHYWGIIKGDNNSIAAISIFDDEVMGIISSADGNLVLGKLKNDADGKHILYNDKNLKASNTTQCLTPDDNGIYSKKNLMNSKVSMLNCIRLYWEVNYDIFYDKGSVTNAANYVTGLFNECAALYANDNIPVMLSQVYVWDVTSPYNSTSTSGLLGQFQAYRNSFSGDLGNLLGYSGGGGIAAGFNGLCASNLDNSQCYSGISSTYQTIPTYSWSVEVVTHEQGHLMGSRHTHACVWNGNNTAIDGCGPAAGYGYEGTCSGAPIPPTGGTIMSYCHLVSAGINFNNGFGPQPAAVILNNFNNATCLTNCTGVGCFAPTNLTSTNVTTTTALLNWDPVPGALSYNIQYRIVGTILWTSATSPVNSYNASGLTSGSNYEWQVQTVCSSGTSTFTFSANFITIPLSCNAPTGLTTDISSTSATFNWNAVGGALSYDIEYREVGTVPWSAGASFSNSYAAVGLKPSTNYEWHVKTNCAGGGTSSNSINSVFTTLLLSFAQNETNNWYFGINAGISFSGGSPIAVTNGAITTTEGCSVISDAFGNLLFYSDGVKVYNSNHSQMPNGYGLFGYHDATQTVLIVKKPGSNNIYYIFTVVDLANPNGICYSIVDMTLNGGLGDITTKNVLLQTPSTEKLAAVKHKNGTDVWIVTHDWLSDAFRCFLLSSSGISLLPVMSNVGIVHNGSNWNTNGYLKISPNGKKIAVAICHYINKFELFDFDNSTGVVSNVVSFPTYPAPIGAYGVEFSRDGTKLYGSLISPGTIYQFDLCAGSPADIINSATIIGTDNNWICALQLGPDGKIYVARTSKDSLGVINNPNATGTACNYVNNGVWLGGNDAQLGFPNFESSYFSLFQYYNLCFGDTTFFYLTDTNSVDSVIWKFDDAASGLNNTSNLFNPYHMFSSQGTYSIQLIRFNNSIVIDTINFCITITSCTTSMLTLSIEHPTYVITPNPNNGFFKIAVDAQSSKMRRIEIFNCTGKKVYSMIEMNASKHFSREIDLSQSPAGIYIVKISDDENTSYVKMVLADD